MNKLFLLSLLAVAVFADPYQCKQTVTDTKAKKSFIFDLTPLYHGPQSPDTIVYNPQTYSAAVTFFNLCGNTYTVCDPESPVCQRTALYFTYGFGALKTQKFEPVTKPGIKTGNGVTVTYTSGSICDTGAPRKATVHVVCSQSSDPSVIDLTTSMDGCTLEATILHTSGCGKKTAYKGGLGFAGVVLILLAVGIVVYIVGGCLFNKYVRHKEGGFTEIFPNYFFWVAFFGLVADGFKFVIHGFKKGDYISV